MKKRAFTLVETMLALLIVGSVSIAGLTFTNEYLKISHERDVQSTALIDNMSLIEEIKAEATSLPQLYSLINGREVSITRIGIGKIDLAADGSFTVVSPESFGFSWQVQNANLYRIDVGGSIPNTKLTAVVMIK